MDQWTIAVLGEGGVGKTELSIAFALNTFVGALLPSQSMPPIIMPDEEPDPQFFRKQFVVDNHMCFVEVRAPTAGQVAKPPENEFLAEAQGFVLVYSIASRSSFDRIEEFHQAVVRVKGADAVFILIGNKCDERLDREVSKDDGAALARQLGCEFVETSAKTAQNVDRTFTNIVRALRQKEAQSLATQNHSGKGKKKKKNCIIL
ncbi:hypothetical protein MSAN_02478300 [Mycena sanguinolenta]|uniref:Ras protein n=1 Tax=Mycena sanguinolenta TaxID=230812 RepID=A0A8H6U2T1_9AGAR|nr:hypothetical protein MSAN_02478300 [Mycena sanguinolenta]